MPQTRQLAAIMFTDIVGYTALMGNDEKKALEMLDKNRAIHRPVIEQYNGRWIKELGDGVMSSFNTASDALTAAIKIQEVCRATNDFQLRIGIHLGEVVFENDDVFGDGVNIASRIESLGIPGAILMSKAIRDQVRNNSDFILTSLGSFDFKNVSEPVEVFALANAGFVVPKKEEMQGKLKQIQKKSGVMKWIATAVLIAASAFGIWFFYIPKKSSETDIEKSIAVLAFVDMSPAKDQEYFSDGLSESLIDVFAKVPSLKVAGRTSSFSFKGKNEDLRTIGKALNVAYVLEGSIQKDGDNLRITAQLIRTLDGIHVWSDKYDRKLKDIFSVQDEISQAILGEIKIKLLGEEKEAVLKRYTDNVEAYQLYLQGRFYYNKFTPDGFFKAIEYFQAAIAIDPNYAIAYAGIAFCYSNLWGYNWAPPDKCRPQAIQNANKALELDDNIAESHLAVGRIKLHNEYKVREAELEFQKAIAINPNSAEIHVQLGFCAAFLGNNKKAIEHAIKAESLDPFSLLNLWYTAVIYYAVGDAEKFLTFGKRIIDLDPNYPLGHLIIGGGYMGLKRYEDALRELELAVKLFPDLQNLAMLGKCYVMMGNKMKAHEIIEQIKKTNGADIAGNGWIGLLYAAIGEWDTAFLYFDKGIQNQEVTMAWIKFHLRGVQMDMKDPRALRLFEKIGQPYE